jgi:hypothetical protein
MIGAIEMKNRTEETIKNQEKDPVILHPAMI